MSGWIGQFPPFKNNEASWKGTHDGVLSKEAKERRAAKKARHLKNVEQRRAENQERARK